MIYLQPSGLVLDSGGLDRLFTLPMESTALGISASGGAQEEGSSLPSVMLFEPSKQAYEDSISNVFSSPNFEEEFQQSVPRMADMPEDQVFLVAKTSALQYEKAQFNATEFLEATAYVHISDADLAGPEYDMPPKEVAKARPTKPQHRKAWEAVYDRYRDLRMDVCGLDLEPIAQIPTEGTKRPEQELKK